jgi:hypothetical protein
MQFLALLVLLPLVRAAPPNIPSADTAFSLLDTLNVEDWSWEGTYKRSEYGDGWKTVKGACNTRETVLKRDGKDVVVNPSTCAAVSGVWYSPYDGATWIKADDIDIDHLVPLSHSWKVSVPLGWTGLLAA